MNTMQLPTYDKGDYVLRTSLYCAGKLMQGKSYEAVDFFMTRLIHDCKLDKLSPIKSREYRWSNSGSANPAENTLWKRPTYWLYNKVLKYLRWNPYKGANGDQLRAFYIVLYLLRRTPAFKRIWFKQALGFIFRLGLTPSLCEWAPLKPQAYVLFLMSAPYGLKYLLYPFIFISQFIFCVSFYKEIEKVTPTESTTNKISSIPTARILNVKKPRPDLVYCRAVYDIYFKCGSKFIGDSVYNGVKAYEV